MRDIHKDLPVKPFTVPDSGLVMVTVSAASGLLPTEFTTKRINEIFLAGTEPTTFDQIEQYDQTRGSAILDNLRGSLRERTPPAGRASSAPRYGEPLEARGAEQASRAATPC